MKSKPLNREERRVLIERLHDALGHAPVPRAARERFYDLLDHYKDCEERAERAEVLLATFTDDEPCWLDHHGYCQSHGWFGEDECNMARARRMLGLDEPAA